MANSTRKFVWQGQPRMKFWSNVDLLPLRKCIVEFVVHRLSRTSFACGCTTFELLFEAGDLLLERVHFRQKLCFRLLADDSQKFFAVFADDFGRQKGVGAKLGRRVLSNRRGRSLHAGEQRLSLRELLAEL